MAEEERVDLRETVGELVASGRESGGEADGVTRLVHPADRTATRLADTARAAADHCPLLEVVNFSYTTVPAVSLAPLLQKCHHLEVLKAAGIASWVGFDDSE